MSVHAGKTFLNNPEDILRKYRMDRRKMTLCMLFRSEDSFLSSASQFSHAVFYVRQFALEAVRPSGDLLICEEKADRQHA
jgi:hypothetical protein